MTRLLVRRIALWRIAVRRIALWGIPIWGMMIWGIVGLRTANAATGEPDGWISETFSQSAQQRLDRLADQITSDDSSEDRELAPLADRFQLATRGNRIYRDAQFEVWRSGAQSVQFANLTEFVSELRRRLRGVQEPTCHFKIVGVSLNDENGETLVLTTITGRLAEGLFEESSRWRVRWRGIAQPRLHQIEVRDIESVRTRGTEGRPVFADATAMVAGRLAAFQRQLLHGQSYWQRRIEGFHGIFNPAQNGLAIADLNGDGLDDLYVCQPGGLPNRIFLHQADGTLSDVTESSSANFLDNTHSALCVDFDNDGDQDLAVATSTALLLLANDGQAKFQLVQAMDKIKDAYSMAAADYDNDGDVDLFVCKYFPSGADVASLPVPIPYFDAKNGGPNQLIENLGGWNFANVTDRSGIDVDNRRFSYAATWLDYDNDGDQDLYVANDFGPDKLYRNLDRNAPGVTEVRFQEISASVGIRHGAFGMSVAAGDFNGDGFEDIYVANMFSSAGNRVTRQPRFRPTATVERRAQFQRLASGNSLFENLHGAQFRDIGTESGVALGRWSWGANFVDFNNDGWEDLLVTNGYITGDDPEDL